MLTAAIISRILAARCLKSPKQAAMSPRQSAAFFASIVSQWADGVVRKAMRPSCFGISTSAHPPLEIGCPESRNKEQIMAKAKQIPSVKASVSTRIPPWFGYVSPTVSTTKVGKFFVTVEVA